MVPVLCPQRAAQRNGLVRRRCRQNRALCSTPLTRRRPCRPKRALARVLRVRVTVKAAERRSAPTALLERAIGGREYVVHCAVYNAQNGRRAAAVRRCPPRPFARPRRPRARWAATIDVLAHGTHPISVGAPPPKPPHARRPRPSPLCDPPRCKSIGRSAAQRAPDTATVGC